MALVSCTGNGKTAGILIELDGKTVSHEIANTFYGIFFEDINHAADGGLYPELVKNRSFENKSATPQGQSYPLAGWILKYKNTGEAAVTAAYESPLFDTNPTYITIEAAAPGYTLANNGYAAVPDIPLGQQYNGYLYARNRTYTGVIVCCLETDTGVTASNEITLTPDSSEWKKYGPIRLNSSSAGKGRFVLTLEGTGVLDLDSISLMPVDTWGSGQPQWPYGGLRKDLAQALADLRPGFIRFPGGCIVEGAWRHETAYNWKDTIGAPEQRKENINLWGYMMSYGLGFHEYFQLCEDMGAEPVPVLNAGILCQARIVPTNEPDYKPGDPEFDQLIQDYLDLIEYANGSADSPWGARRGANGHPAPFNLKKIGIGNENWSPAYWRNFKAIREAVLAVYPEIDIITTSGPDDSGPIYNEAYTYINAHYTDAIVDEHYYNEPEWFLKNSRRYDTFRRNGIRIFVGEYAAHEKSRVNSWYTALCEASYATGLERNADIIKMASYAPLFAHESQFQWAPDLIWFNSLGVTNRTPNYEVQKLFSTNTGKLVLPSKAIPNTQELFHASSIDGNRVYTKLVNPYDAKQTVTVRYENIGELPKQAAFVLLSGDKPAKKAAIAENPVPVKDSAVTVVLPPYSAAVIRIP
jgi:alpha-L-arabinofuranosidase